MQTKFSHLTKMLDQTLLLSYLSLETGNPLVSKSLFAASCAADMGEI